MLVDCFEERFSSRKRGAKSPVRHCFLRSHRLLSKTHVTLAPRSCSCLKNEENNREPKVVNFLSCNTRQKKQKDSMLCVFFFCCCFAGFSLFAQNSPVTTTGCVLSCCKLVCPKKESVGQSPPNHPSAFFFFFFSLLVFFFFFFFFSPLHTNATNPATQPAKCKTASRTRP